MSLLPGRILPQTEPWGRLEEDGITVAIDKNWWLFLYNLSSQVLGSGGLPLDAIISIEGADGDAADSDAIALRQPIANLAVQFADLAPTAADFPDIARALLLAQDGLLTDPQPRAQPVQTITVGASTFVYTAPFDGTVVVFGGTVSGVAFSRDGGLNFYPAPLPGATSTLVPVSRLDQVRVIYSVLPTMALFPR